MKRTQGERIIYPVGEEFDVEKVVKDTRSEYERINITFINHHCERCSLRGKYTKSKFGREITHIFQMEEYQKEARRNVKSGEELKLMFQRNKETMKQKEHLETGKANQKYDRLYRRGENGVKYPSLLSE